ncbi:MAG: YopX family protein [Treponema sp.]|jgi:hypothetical protein|nr:YopX family protein [Treponema sp.]
MRGIEFRGIGKLSEKWEFGFLCEIHTGILAIQPRFCDGDIGIERIKVIPETVGQYTGLKDKNGVKIFEGDIVKTFNEDSSVWKLDEVIFSESAFCIDSFCPCLAIDAEFNITVIGNIHDNPELLHTEDKA